MGFDFKVFKGSPSGEIVEARGYRELQPTEVLVQISHCGVCGTDEHYRWHDQGLGHEGIGIIKELGTVVPSISDLKTGDRVGLGWFHKFCGYCKSCLTGRQNHCLNSSSFGTADWDQGCFSTAIAWDVSTVYRIPDAIESKNAGPLICGGATVWTPLYEAGLKPNQRVGIVGIGGLGHLAIQFASKLGFDTVVFTSTESKKQDAIDLGAAEVHVTTGISRFQAMEKVDLLLITTNNIPDISLYLPIMQRDSVIYPLTISTENMNVSPLGLISHGVSIVGSGIASSRSMQAMLDFAARHKVKPQIEEFSMTQSGISEAMQKLRDGKMRYRGVIVV